MSIKEIFMPNCKYCGKPAGFFRWKHSECHDKHQSHVREIERSLSVIKDLAIASLESKSNCELLKRKIIEIQDRLSIPDSQIRLVLIEAWEKIVEYFLDDGILDEAEEVGLNDFKSCFALSQEELNKNGAFLKMGKATVLREVLNGVIPSNVTLNTNLSVNLQKDEQIVWAFPNSKYLEDKTRRQAVGSSQGVSVRVMKGLYYRTGTFKGRSISYTERVHVDTGLVIVTNKNIYFVGSQKSLRLPYGKIISFEPFSDGIGIMRDASTAKPQIFVTEDGWFIYNLVTNLSKLSAG